MPAKWMKLPKSLLLIFTLILPLLIQVLACSLVQGLPGQEAGATITALQQTINAGPATQTPLPTPLPTQAPSTSQATEPAAAPSPQPAATTTGASNPPANLEALIKSANILLFEDITGNLDIYRYVAAAFERLGLKPYDVGDAQGRLKTALMGGPGQGKAWDLIVIAAEDRDQVQGEFFEYLENILDQGKTAVILETWYLDQISQGTAKPILMRCGVDVVSWVGVSHSPSDLKIYPLISNSPLLNEVVSVSQFRIADYWPYEFQGNLMNLNGMGDAQLILGIDPKNVNGNGVLANCFNSRLILQTFSSHNYLDETSVSLWMNYIHYALRMHFSTQ